jgi:hypothetical protein
VSTGHEPDESATVTVRCAVSGPPAGSADWQREAVLADLEAFCAELRRLGAPGSTVITGATDLRVTLDRAVP